MRKLLSLLIALVLVALPVCAEENAAPATEENAPTEGGWLDADGAEAETEAEAFMLQGVIVEIADGSITIYTEDMGNVLVLVSEETVQETNHDLEVGSYIYVDYNGQMTRSLPPQVTAARIVSHRLEGDVLATYPEENALLLYASDGMEYRVNLPASWAETGFDAQRAIVYFNGAATLSIPPQISVGRIVAEYAMENTISELSETSMVLGEGESAVRVNFDPALLPEGLAVGDAVRVTYDGTVHSAEGEQDAIDAVAIVKVGA